VLARHGVEDATNEITRFRPLVDLDLAGVAVTADALHAQRDHAGFLDRGAGYLLIVKADEPTSHHHLRRLP
jgi:hypothetical protein